MSKILKTKTVDGAPVEYLEDKIGEGAMKEVFFTPDKKNVVAFFKTKQDFNAEDRLEKILKIYNPTLDSETGKYWQNLYCWPTDIVKDDGKLGLVMPAYPKHFFFTKGFHKNKEKEGKWFASAMLRKLLDPSERGTWIDYIRISILISRAVRKLHSGGLAHSDLSYKNVLIDPQGTHAAIIDIDGLVVPQKYPPEVIGTPDFIAPEVFKTQNLAKDDRNRKLPSRKTDLHALPVLIYMYLLYRHPLRGGKFHDLDPNIDELMAMGEKALFIEHSKDKSNKPKENNPAYLPWSDVDKMPYNLCGPYLSKLFDRAFVDGLHNPDLRPSANEWEDDLIRTLDLLQPCGNTNCEQKWFVFDNTTKPKCPFCGWEFKGYLPILNFYSARKGGVFGPDNHRLMVYHNQYLYSWHANRKFWPNEKLHEKDKKPVGYFSFFKNRWVLVNQGLPFMKDVTENKLVPIGSMVELSDKKQILLSNDEGGRLAFVQLISA